LESLTESWMRESDNQDGFWESSMLVEYARVSTREQKQALQLDALQAAGRANA
jgi:predicted site-specific integrase-resolvase